MPTFPLEIITPERIAYQEQVEMVVVPGSDGYMGILPHHISLFSLLTEGEIKIKKENEDYFLSIGGGFVEVTQEKVRILVTKALHAHELNEQEILQAKERAEKILKEKPVGEDLEAAVQLLRSSLVDLRVLGRRKYRSTPVA